MYSISYSAEAEADLAKLKRNEPKSFEKAVKLLNEIVIHPKTGTGHPEPLKGKPENRWSRQITKKHRIVYRILKQKSTLMSSPPTAITATNSPILKSTIIDLVFFDDLNNRVFDYSKKYRYLRFEIRKEILTDL